MLAAARAQPGDTRPDDTRCSGHENTAGPQSPPPARPIQTRGGAELSPASTYRPGAARANRSVNRSTTSGGASTPQTLQRTVNSTGIETDLCVARTLDFDLTQGDADEDRPGTSELSRKPVPVMSNNPHLCPAIVVRTRKTDVPQAGLNYGCPFLLVTHDRHVACEKRISKPRDIPDPPDIPMLRPLHPGMNEVLKDGAPPVIA